MLRPTSFWLSCPRCQRACDMFNRVLFDPERIVQLWCGNCKRLASSRKLACSCGHSWMICTIHRALGFTCRARLTLKTKVRLGHARGLDCHRACNKRRKVAALGELGSGCPPMKWPLPPPFPSGPSGTPPCKRKVMGPSAFPPPGPFGLPGAAGPPRPPPRDLSPEHSQDLMGATVVGLPCIKYGGGVP